MPGLPRAEQNIQNDEDARLAAMQRALGTNGITMGTANPNNPLGVGATPPSLGATGSQQVAQATGSASVSPSTAASLGLAPSGPNNIAQALGTNTVNPDTLAPGTKITGVSSAPSYNMDTLRAQASAAAAAVAAPPSTISGSLGSSLTPPTGKYQGGNLFPNATAPAMQNPSSVTSTANAPGARTADIGAEPSGAPGAGTKDITAGQDAGQAGGSAGLQNLTNTIMSQLQTISQSLSSPGTPVDASAVYMKQATSILAMLDDQEKALRAENATQGTTIDPATQFTLDKLRQNLEDGLKTTRETLNSRGLYDSGIELQLENNLQKGNASDQAMILSNRLSKLQDQLNTGLSSIRQQKFSTASSFGLAGANAQNAWDENSRKLAYEREQAALQGMLNLRGQVGNEDTARANNIAAMQRAVANEQGASSRNKATIDAENARAAASLAENQRQFGTLSAAQQAAAARAAATGPKTTTQTTAQTAAQTAATVVGNVQKNFETREDAVSYVQNSWQDLVNNLGTAGAQAVLRAADALPSGRNTPGRIANY